MGKRDKGQTAGSNYHKFRSCKGNQPGINAENTGENQTDNGKKFSYANKVSKSIIDIL